jgi:hypothetical protein
MISRPGHPVLDSQDRTATFDSQNRTLITGLTGEDRIARTEQV